MGIYEKFLEEGREEVAAMAEDAVVHDTAQKFRLAVRKYKYPYHFEWLGRPIIQYPTDIVAVQELIWHVKPDLIIETGIAHGGSLIFSASMLTLLDYADAVNQDPAMTSVKLRRHVVGVDVDIRPHNRAAIEAHPFSSRITMIEGSSVDPKIVNSIYSLAEKAERVMVCLDSNHTHAHVLAELEAYAPLTSIGSYCIAFDTIIEDTPAHLFPDRPWGPGNNPKTAVKKYLKTHPEFEIDHSVYNKLQLSVAPDGYLKRIK